MATGQLVGGLIGPLFGGFLADRLGRLSAGFLRHLGSRVGRHAGQRSFFVREHFKPNSAAKRASFWESLHEIARHRQLAPMFVVVLLAQVVAFGVQPIVPLFVRALVGNVPWLATAAGLAFAVTGLADLIASPFFGKRSDRIGYRRVLLISLLRGCLLYDSAGFRARLGAFIALRFGVGLFLGGVLPTANALIGRIFPLERRGQVFGHYLERNVPGHVLPDRCSAEPSPAASASRRSFLTIGAMALANLSVGAASVRTPPAALH